MPSASFAKRRSRDFCSRDDNPISKRASYWRASGTISLGQNRVNLFGWPYYYHIDTSQHAIFLP